MSFEIRKAVPEDAQKILDFTRIFCAETDNLTFGAEGLPVSPEDEEKYIREMADSDKNAFFVMRENGEIIGTAGCWRQSSILPGILRRLRSSLSKSDATTSRRSTFTKSTVLNGSAPSRGISGSAGSWWTLI